MGADLSDDGRYLGWILNEDGYLQPYVKDLQNGGAIITPQLKGMYTYEGSTDDGRLLLSFNNANNAPICGFGI